MRLRAHRRDAFHRGCARELHRPRRSGGDAGGDVEDDRSGARGPQRFAHGVTGCGGHGDRAVRRGALHPRAPRPRERRGAAPHPGSARGLRGEGRGHGADPPAGAWDSMKTLLIAVRAAVYGTGFVLLWGWVALSVRRFDPEIGGVLPAWTRPLGIVLMVVGAAVAVSCVAVFVARGRGTPAPFDPPREFVALGPYKYVRNPMYVGGLGVLAGFGLYQRSPAILLFAVVLLLAVQLFVVLYEEPGLERRFGQSYRDYKRSVNRWLPRA